MRTEAKGYFLKEYGSWSVLAISYLIGIGVSRGFTWLALPVFFALGLLINSRQAFTKWMRQKGDGRSLAVFLGQVFVATAILLAVFGPDVPRLLPLLVIPAAYLILNRFAGEHFVITEVLGFTLISLAAVLAKFLITNGLDIRLFVAVALYFTAGVFKIKALLFKKTMDRVFTVLYVLFVVVVYRGFHLSLLLLLPLLENLVAASTLYKVRLQTTGWIEVAKSLAFFILMLLYY
jgi:hypothetical protein